MLDYMKTLAIIITFLLLFTGVIAVISEIRQAGIESTQYENQF